MNPALDRFENPLGFTKETASLLTGLRCSNLTKFKKKDICLDDLKGLSREDLAVLDVGDNFDYASFEKLQNSLRKKKEEQSEPTSFDDIFQIIESTHRQVRVLNIYMKCISASLVNEKTDYFIEFNQAITVADALIRASDNVLEGITNFENVLDEKQSNKSQQDHTMRYFIVGGLGVIVVTCILYFRH